MDLWNSRLAHPNLLAMKWMEPAKKALSLDKVKYLTPSEPSACWQRTTTNGTMISKSKVDPRSIKIGHIDVAKINIPRLSGAGYYGGQVLEASSQAIPVYMRDMGEEADLMGP